MSIVAESHAAVQCKWPVQYKILRYRYAIKQDQRIAELGAHSAYARSETPKMPDRMFRDVSCSFIQSYRPWSLT